MRIAVVNSASEMGGAELSLIPVARALAADHEVVAFLPGAGPLFEAFRELGIETNPLRLGASLVRASRQYGVAHSVRLLGEALVQQARFTRILRQTRADIVYCNGFRAQLGATLPAKLAGAWVVWHVRDFVPGGLPSRAFAVLGRAADVLIANSAATAAQPALRGRAVVVRNGIDLETFTRSSAEPADPPLVGMVGHLTPWKGHERFLRVLRLVRERMPEVRGVIAGAAIYDTADHDAYASKIVAAAEAEGTRVESVSPAGMPRWLERLALLIHCPERPEPFGRALAEALALGVPVVTTSGGGAPEVVGEAGILVAEGGDVPLADAVFRLLEDAERRRALAAAGIARARREFDERRYTEDTVRAILAGSNR